MSLHTKYRPLTFDEVLGQDVAVRSLKRAVKDNRAHVFLLVGPAGVGKTTLARILANELAKGGVANLYEYDAASKSGADDVRSLVNNLYYKAIGASPVKFVIIDECQKLSAAAWDVLLKPTEEPPAHVYYAFCTTNPTKIPKAIITRCLRYELKPVKEDLILELLVSVIDSEKLVISDDIIELIAESCEGSPRQALVFLETCHEAKSLSEARELMRTAAQSKEPVDLARMLISKQGANWQSAVKIVNTMSGVEAESIRIIVTNYIAGALNRTKSEREAKNLLRVLECFSKPYNSSDKLAPLFLSIGLALELDQ